MDLTGWQIRRYANGSTSPQTYDLTGSLAPGELLVFAQDADDFQSVHGFFPDDASQTISGNGDDVYELWDGSQTVDLFGVIGDDTGPWLYVEQSAQRLPGVVAGSPVWNAAEWTFVDWSNASPGQR